MIKQDTLSADKACLMSAGNECARLVNRLRAKLPEDAKHSLDANMAAIAPAFDIEVLSHKNDTATGVQSTGRLASIPEHVTLAQCCTLRTNTALASTNLGRLASTPVVCIDCGPSLIICILKLPSSSAQHVLWAII